MFKNILVASDGSKCGDKAVDLAIDLASKYGAKISALYVMDFALDFSYDDLDDAGGAVLDEITAKGKEKDVVVVEHIITADPIQDMATMIWAVIRLKPFMQIHLKVKMHWFVHRLHVEHMP